MFGFWGHHFSHAAEERILNWERWGPSLKAALPLSHLVPLPVGLSSPICNRIIPSRFKASKALTLGSGISHSNTIPVIASPPSQRKGKVRISAAQWHSPDDRTGWWGDHWVWRASSQWPDWVKRRTGDRERLQQGDPECTEWHFLGGPCACPLKSRLWSRAQGEMHRCW